VHSQNGDFDVHNVLTNTKKILIERAGATKTIAAERNLKTATNTPCGKLAIAMVGFVGYVKNALTQAFNIRIPVQKASITYFLWSTEEKTRWQTFKLLTFRAIVLEVTVDPQCSFG
jgi:hypothetical protein